MPSVLFVHNGAPGRFSFLAGALSRQGWTGYLINGPEGTDLPGMTTVRWTGPVSSQADILALEVEKSLQRGHYAMLEAVRLKKSGFTPDIIIGHPAWGEMVFLKQVFPNAPQIQIAEAFFRTNGSEFNFDPEFPVTKYTSFLAQHSVNAVQTLTNCDAARLVSPTFFQAETYPDVLKSNISVIHEGVDTEIARPDRAANLVLKDGSTLNRDAPIITFINRRFEPMRGFHIFMRSLPKVMSANPDAHVIIIGVDGPDSYGRPHAGGSWKQALLEEISPICDLRRIHFVGALSYDVMCTILSLSWAHVHFSYPSILSWSLLDALSCGCLVIGSNTASIREVVQDGKNGLLVDFFDVDGLSSALIKACKSPESLSPLRVAARSTILSEYDRERVCQPKWLKLIRDLT